MELDQVLRRFYAESRAKDGELYSRSSSLAIRNAIERFLNNPPHSRAINIAKGEEEVYFQKKCQLWSFLPVSETKRSWRVWSCLVWKQAAWREQAPEHDERHLQSSRIIADLYQSFFKSHGHQFMVRCPDILPSHNEYLRSLQRREHQAHQHETFVKSTSPMFGHLVRGVFLTKRFKPFDTGWIACQSSWTTPIDGCSCSK